MISISQTELKALRISARLYIQAVKNAYPDLKESLAMRVMRQRLEKLTAKTENKKEKTI